MAVRNGAFLSERYLFSKARQYKAQKARRCPVSWFRNSHDFADFETKTTLEIHGCSEIRMDANVGIKRISES
jgi:hypothetical protein